MPRIEPATAVANSQRKNSWPSSYSPVSRTSCSCRSGPVGGLARRRHETLALLARRLGEQLLGPEAEAGVALRDADLVAPVAPALAEREPELEPGIALGEPARLRHLLGALEQPRHVDAHQRRRHHPERRERRVAAADRRLAREDGRELALARELLELGAGVGDRREQIAVPPGALPEVVGVRARLERRARLRRREEQRPRQVEASPRARGSPSGASCRARGTSPHGTCAGSPPARATSRPCRAARPRRRGRRRSPRTAAAGRRPPPSATARRASRATSPRRRPSRPTGRAPRSARRVALAAHAAASSPRFARIQATISSNESANFCTPSASSVSVTSS